MGTALFSHSLAPGLKNFTGLSHIPGGQIKRTSDVCLRRRSSALGNLAPRLGGISGIFWLRSGAANRRSRWAHRPGGGITRDSLAKHGTYSLATLSARLLF